MIKIWEVKNRRSNYEWEGELIAYWEVVGDPISDDYLPEEIDAEDLFKLWTDEIHKRHPDGLIPISWYVVCRKAGKFEFMPFQVPFSKLYGDKYEGELDDVLSENFLTFFTWPVDKKTGEFLNWLSLPVEDKLWNNKRADKGGFIQEFTGWKPSVLQPYVYLPSLSQLR